MGAWLKLDSSKLLRKNSFDIRAKIHGSKLGPWQEKYFKSPCCTRNIYEICIKGWISSAGIKNLQPSGGCCWNNGLWEAFWLYLEHGKLKPELTGCVGKAYTQREHRRQDRNLL